MVVDVGVDRGELLQGLHLPKLQHSSLPSSKGQVAVLDPVVSPAAVVVALSRRINAAL